MTFAHEQGVADFAGGDPSTSVVPEPARKLLARFDAHSAHYQLIGEGEPRHASS